MKKVDLRPTLSEAVKVGHLWLIDGVDHNFLRPANKFGEECGMNRLNGRERFAKYVAGSNFLVGVFLAVRDTAKS